MENVRDISSLVYYEKKLQKETLTFQVIKYIYLMCFRALPHRNTQKYFTGGPMKQEEILQFIRVLGHPVVAG